jgi:hypothetical protein
VRGGVADFSHLIQDFRTTQSLLYKGLITVPVVAIWLRLGPPNNYLASATLSVLELLVLIFAFATWYAKPLRSLKLRLVVSLSLCFAGLVGLFLFAEYFTVNTGKGRDRVVIGSTVRSEILPLLGPDYTVRDALRDSEYDAEKVWTTSSVHLISTLYEMDWVITIVTFTSTLASFTILQRRAAPAQEPVEQAPAAD